MGVQPTQGTCLESIGSEEQQAGPSDDMIKQARTAVCRTLGAPVCDDEVVPDVPTPIQHSLLAAWRQAAGDPDDQVESCLKSGAPAGLAMPIVRRDIFPETIQESGKSDLEDLVVADMLFSNSAGSDGNDDAWTELLGVSIVA